MQKSFNNLPVRNQITHKSGAPVERTPQLLLKIEVVLLRHPPYFATNSPMPFKIVAKQKRKKRCGFLLLVFIYNYL